MHGVAAKIPEEVSMLLEHQRLNACPTQEIPQHHSGGSAADDATFGMDDAPDRSLRRNACVHDLALVV
jgi:hypothetical protein